MVNMEIIKAIYHGIEVFFIGYLVIYTCFIVISVTVGAVTLHEQKRRRTTYNYIQQDYNLPISVLVPAHNESITVLDTIQSLLELEYRLYEIVVVDDGSTDNTAQCVIDAFHMQKITRPIRRRVRCKKENAVYVTYDYKVPITLVCKENGGKADALNMGVNVSEYPYVVCMDADSMLQYDALENIARCVMETDNVIACGGLVRIVNNVTLEKGHVVDYRMPKKLTLSMQVLEYDRSFLASRILFDKFNGNLIISGAFGLFKKDFLIDVGGYDIDTMGEDMELVVRMHAFARANKIPYRIRYASDAVCWSQAPSTLTDLKKQRRRWHIGLFQSMLAHRQMLFNPRYGSLSFISFLYFFIYELLSPYIEVFGIISVIFAAYFNLINVPFMIGFFAVYIVFNALFSLTAFFSRIHAMNIKMRPIDIVKAVIAALAENAGLRIVLAWTRFAALFGYRSKKNEWGSIQRHTMKDNPKQSK